MFFNSSLKIGSSQKSHISLTISTCKAAEGSSALVLILSRNGHLVNIRFFQIALQRHLFVASLALYSITSNSTQAFAGDMMSLQNQKISVQFSLSPQEKAKLGNAIARRELGPEGLIDWARSEDFASLGVMHATWGSEKTIKHQNGFIQFLSYAESRGAQIPSFLATNKENPWLTRGSFFYAKYSHDARMMELQRFLEKTHDLQVDFTIARASEACTKIVTDSRSKRY